MSDGLAGPVPILSRPVAWCAVAYLVALGAALGVGYALRDAHPFVIAGAADAAATVVIFAFSFGFNNSSFYDPYWSVAPMVIGAYWLWLGLDSGADSTRQVVAVAVVWLWGLRLTYNWLSGWRGLGHEDWRYIDLRKQTGRAFWLVSFSGIMMFPTVLVFMGCMSLFPALTVAGRPLGWLDGLAVLVTLGATAIEAVADLQLRKFRREKTEPGAIMSSGLWAYSRHPNYFGEILFWWGLYLFALAAAPEYWWTVVGPGAITILFIFISIPMIDKRHLERRPNYAEHVRRVSGLIPWFPKS